jgi:hypothetical protein
MMSQNIPYIEGMIPVLQSTFEKAMEDGVSKTKKKRIMGDIVCHMGTMEKEIGSSGPSQATKMIYESLKVRINQEIIACNNRIRTRRAPYPRTRSRIMIDPIDDSARNDWRPRDLNFRQLICIPEDKCPICLDKFKHMVMTKCGHYFCSPCIEKSLSLYGDCPMCRRNLDT